MIKQKESLKSSPQPSLNVMAGSSSSYWSYMSAIAVGLLSSSCCIIQMVLNLMSIGCAGFSVLTPYRPLFLAISSLLVLYTLYKYKWSSRSAITLALVLTLTTTPEMVAMYNQSSTGSLQRIPDSSKGPLSILHLSPLIDNVQRAIPSFLTSLRGAADNKPKDVVPSAMASSQDASQEQGGIESIAGDIFIKYVVQIEGMACEACASRLRQHFSRQAGIERANVFFSDKKLVLWTRAEPGSIMLSERAIQDMVAQVDFKYSARLENTFSFKDMTA
ncbi:hypothetical protein FBU30_007593 [Linnemannia zychae]|nr:hypothetical protein FBU30_007593 [Linnemannia zychae]